ncbi:MAG: hypothetical protein ABIJ81_02480 [Patescibacteria group bacterium]
MELIKIFTHGADNGDFSELEKEVNSWLIKNKVSIIARNVISAVIKDSTIYCSIVIFYKK